MINNFLTNYQIARVLTEEWNCYGYRKGTYKIRFVKMFKIYRRSTI